MLGFHIRCEGRFAFERLGLRETFGRPSHVTFNNPDFVKYAESFGATGLRVGQASDLLPMLGQALASDTVTVIDCQVDYSENMKLTKRLQELKSPLTR